MSTETPTEGIAPKAAAATIAAIVGPLLASLVGVDAAAGIALVTAVLTFAAAWLAPPSGITGREHDDYEPDDDQLPTYLMGRDDDPTPVKDEGDGNAPTGPEKTA